MKEELPAGIGKLHIAKKDSFTLTSTILAIASEGLSRADFFRQTLKALAACTKTDVVIARVAGCRGCPDAVASLRDGDTFQFAVTEGEEPGPIASLSADGRKDVFLEILRSSLAQGKLRDGVSLSSHGSLWTNVAADLFRHFAEEMKSRAAPPVRWEADCRSQAWIPLEAREAGHGYLQFGFVRGEAFGRDGIEDLEHIAQVVSAALLQWHTTGSLKERVKELSCLYAMGNILDGSIKPLDEILGEIVEVIPGAWLYEDLAAARLTFDGRAFATKGFEESMQRQAAEIRINDRLRGLLEVSYRMTMPELDEGPFLREERKLLDTVARELSIRIERWLYKKEQQQIKQQMRHSNRLAMIGQLAAAVAHEINEPLTSILGFAQLAAKDPLLPPQAALDLDKIVATSLHVREVVRKLLMYGRKMPQRECPVDVNKAVKEGISLFEHRLAREGIALELDCGHDVGEIHADPIQLRQVVANLFLNAMQALADGGTISVRTARSNDDIVLTIEDTGCGMTPEVKDKIFIPFFTTKEPSQGTGLGLSVVLDIVKGLRGAIHVESSPGVGTCIEVRLPVMPRAEGAARGRVHP